MENENRGQVDKPGQKDQKVANAYVVRKKQSGLIY